MIIFLVLDVKESLKNGLFPSVPCIIQSYQCRNEDRTNLKAQEAKKINAHRAVSSMGEWDCREHIC